MEIALKYINTNFIFSLCFADKQKTISKINLEVEEKSFWAFFVCILQDLDQGLGVISYIISVIAKIKLHAHHETHLRSRKIIRIHVTSVQEVC